MPDLHEIRDATKNSVGFSGTCVHCGKPAAKEAIFDSDGVLTVERYCAVCSEPETFERL